MRSLAILVAAGMMAAPAEAAPPELPRARIAVLDYQAVLRDSVAAQQIRTEIDELRKVYQEQMAREEAELREEEHELRRLRESVAPDLFDESRRRFERRVQETQRRAHDQLRSLDRTFDQAMGQLRRRMVPIAAEITKQMGFNLVVDKSQILFAARALDISDEVAAELNAQLPRVDVARPGR